MEDERRGSEVEAVLEASHLTYAYPDGTLALADVNVRLGRGEVVAIVGPSGCGKSTLLRCMAGLENPTSGSVHRRPGSHRSGVNVGTELGFVFQKDTLLPWRTVEENVEFGIRYLPLDRNQRKERVDSLLAMGGLSDARKRYPYQLSGGMSRRAAFLMTVAVYPQILLLDEPFSGLDEPTKLKVLASVMAIVRRLEMSVVLVTHDLAEAISVADRVYIFRRNPGAVADEQHVAMPRDVEIAALRERDDYARSYQLLWHSLRMEIERPTDGADQ